MFNGEKVSPLATQLTMSHYRLLLFSLNNKIDYYINKTIEELGGNIPEYLQLLDKSLKELKN